MCDCGFGNICGSDSINECSGHDCGFGNFLVVECGAVQDGASDGGDYAFRQRVERGEKVE